MKFKYSWLPVAFLGLTTCDVNNNLDSVSEQKTEVIAVNPNGLDFSNYVAVGASFSSGFTDNALFIAAQENSFPNTLSKKFAMAGGGNFTQPLMADNVGGILFGGTQIQQPRLFFDGSSPASLSVLGAVPTTDLANTLSGQMNNYGIPGAKSFHFVAPGYGSITAIPSGQANPYFARFASGATATILGDAVANRPTFFTLSEIGGNDLLGYALAGGDGKNQKGNSDPAAYGPDDITDPDVFADVFNSMVTALTANGAKGVVGNLPYITSLPHFTTVPYNPLPLDVATAVAVNQGYQLYNEGIQRAFVALVTANAVSQAEAEAEIKKRTIEFNAGQNPVVIIDEDLTDLGALNPAFAALPQYRQTTSDDLLILTSSSFIGTPADPGNPLSINGVTVPLADRWVLTPSEQTILKEATDAFNATIESVADTNDNLVLVDLKTVLVAASETGIQFDDFILNTNLVTGGLVSLDGVHLTARGYALMANEILKAMDKPVSEGGFGTNFSQATNGLAKANDFPTNYSPVLR